MSDTVTDADKIQVRLTRSPEEVESAQRLRYQVFYNEFKAKPTPEMEAEGRDMDQYDPIADHLIVVDKSLPEGEQIVGTYRLLRREIAEQHGQFYTSDEYDIQPLLDNGDGLLELGRSCVLEPYRTRPVLKKLWQGIAAYVAENNIGLMFGCASLHGTDPEAVKQELAYLYHFHLAEEDLCPRAIDSRFVEMNTMDKADIDERSAFSSLPPLIKGYLRLGASIGNGAVVDHQFNTIDVCIVLPTARLAGKYMRHYERANRKENFTEHEIEEALSDVANGSR